MVRERAIQRMVRVRERAIQRIWYGCKHEQTIMISFFQRTA